MGPRRLKPRKGRTLKKIQWTVKDRNSEGLVSRGEKITQSLSAGHGDEKSRGILPWRKKKILPSVRLQREKLRGKGVGVTDGSGCRIKKRAGRPERCGPTGGGLKKQVADQKKWNRSEGPGIVLRVGGKKRFYIDGKKTSQKKRKVPGLRKGRPGNLRGGRTTNGKLSRSKTGRDPA